MLLLQDCFRKFNSYLRLERDYSKATIISYRRDFADFLEFLEYEGIEPELENITTPILRDFITYLVERKDLSPNSIRRKFHSLRSFFKFVTSQEYIVKNPSLPILPPKKKLVIPVYLPEEDLRALLDAPTKDRSRRTWFRDKLILETFAFTGIRRQELLDLEWRDVNFNEGTMKVRGGKGDKDRILPLPPSLQQGLEAYKSVQTVTDMTPVFLSVNNKRITSTPLQQMFKHYIKVAGLEGKGYSIHKLRHSYATLLMQQGVDLVSIQELLGHSDINATRIYLHTDANRLRDSMMKHPLLEGHHSNLFNTVSHGH